MSILSLTRIEAMFISPLAVFEISDCDALNRQLLDETAALRGQARGIERSNRSGWHSDGDFFRRSEPGFRALRDHILEAVRTTIMRLAPNFSFNAYLMEAEGWINVNPRGAFNVPHTHSGSALSGTYYVSIPPDAQEQSGLFEFLDPRVNAAAMEIEGAPCFNRQYTLKPKVGLLVIFPSYLWHWVYPNEADSDRVSIAFNIRLHKRGAVPGENAPR